MIFYKIIIWSTEIRGVILELIATSGNNYRYWRICKGIYDGVICYAK